MAVQIKLFKNFLEGNSQVKHLLLSLFLIELYIYSSLVIFYKIRGWI